MVITNYKLLGVVRLRQIKMRPWDDFCAPPEEFQGMVIDRCDVEISNKSTIDQSNYSPSWRAYNASTAFPNRFQTVPFIYQSGEETGTRDKVFDYEVLSGGGYIAYLGRKPINTRIILNHLVKRDWFTNRTRYIFVEFLAYNVHANYFNAITMIFHLSRSGDISKSYSIETFRAFTVSEWGLFWQIILYVFFVVQSLNISVRHAHQMKYCLFRLQAFQDTLVICLTVTTMASYAYRFVLSKVLVEKIHSSPLNQYISMDRLLLFEYFSKITTGLLCWQNLVHLIDLGHATPWIRIFYYMLVYAMEYILICIVLTIIFLISFSTAFHFILGQDNFLFHHFWLSYIQTFAVPFSARASIEFEYRSVTTLIPYVIFTFYGYTFRFLICNMFSVVLVNSYHRARLRLGKQCFKYTLRQFFKERVFGGVIPFDKPRIVGLTQSQILKRTFKPLLVDKPDGPKIAPDKK